MSDCRAQMIADGKEFVPRTCPAHGLGPCPPVRDFDCCAAPQPTIIPAGELTAKHIGRQIGFTYPIATRQWIQGTLKGMEVWQSGLRLFLSEHDRQWYATHAMPVTILPEAPCRWCSGTGAIDGLDCSVCTGTGVDDA